MTENEVAREIVDVAYRVHSTIGPGLLESVYQEIVAMELEKRGLAVVRQQPVPLIYDGVVFETAFRADLIVADSVIVEIKSIGEFNPVHRKQLITYLRLANKRLGLLINFNVVLIKDGIVRVANGLKE